jgi:hypothetical protein
MHPRTILLVPFSLALIGCNDSDGNAVPPSLQFGSPQRYPLGGTVGRELAFADLDGDAVDDAVVALSGSNAFTLLTGLRPSGFESPRVNPAVDRPDVIVVGDLDADRVPDVVTGSANDDRVGVARNLGDGGFASLVLLQLPTPTRDLAIMDATGDGLADIVSASATVNGLHILPGPGGTGSFGAPLELQLPAMPGDLVVGDFDGNGSQDLAVASAGGGVVLVLPQAAGGFGPAVETPTDALGGKLVAGDLDGDDRLDLAVLTVSGSAVDSLLGNGTGGFRRVGTQQLGGIVDSLALPDLDGDGRLDLVASTDIELRVCYGQGDGQFRAPEIAVNDVAGVSAVVARDTNADGRPDLGYVTDRAELAVLTNPRALENGIAPYGTGTPDCAGAIVMTGNSRPYLGNLDFEYVVANAPARRGGVIAIAFGQDAPGTDPFGLGFLVHLLPGSEVNPRFLVSDANGGARDPYEIPELPGLVGGTVYAQTVWLGDVGGCSPSPVGISSSRGLALTVQPR